jgi:hypothetical protein
MAAGRDAFGQLVHDEAVPTREPSPVAALRDALAGLHGARTRMDELLVAGVPPDLLELHVAVLSTVKRLLRELDLAERIRRQIQLRPPRPRPRPRHPGGHPPPPPRPAAPEPEPDAETQPLPRLPEDRG